MFTLLVLSINCKLHVTFSWNKMMNKVNKQKVKQIQHCDDF